MESLGTSPKQMMEVMEDRELWRLNLALQRNPGGKAGNEERRRLICNECSEIYLLRMMESQWSWL